MPHMNHMSLILTDSSKNSIKFDAWYNDSWAIFESTGMKEKVQKLYRYDVSFNVLLM